MKNLKRYPFKTLPDGSAVCGNCGGPIPPDSQVSVILDDHNPAVCHSTYQCSTAGNARYGIWGKGELLSLFGEIEQC